MEAFATIAAENPMLRTAQPAANQKQNSSRRPF
jgi:hypothetical protein